MSKTIEIENGESIVSKANDSGIDIPFSCMQGMSLLHCYPIKWRN